MTVHIKLFIAVVFGGLTSLAVCGQFGMGVTDWANALSHSLHENMPPLLCASICGTLFALFPTLLLRLVLCSPLQFRVIVLRKLPTLSLWYGGTGILLASYGQHGQGSIEIMFWFLSAILSSYVLATVLKFLLPAWSFPRFISA